MLRIKNITSKRKILIIVILVVATFLTWFIIRLATTDTTLNLIKTYEISELTSLKDLYSLNDGDYAVAIDGNVVTGKSFESGSLEIRPTASTAKMILSLAVMKEKPFDLGTQGETLTMTQEDYSRYAWYYNNGGSNTAVQVGEEISQYDALVSILLASSNNMADSLATWAFGSIDNYREYANGMLNEYGILNTTIGEDASGFSETTTSTAADLAKIGALVLENPVLVEIVNTKTYTVPVSGTINNTNQLLGTDGIVGIKTGYIGDVSGYCLVTGYKEGEHIITTALLGAPSRADSFDESLGIVKAMQGRARVSELVKIGQIVGYYDSWWTGRVEIAADESLSELAWVEADIDTDLVIDDGSGVLKVNIAGKTYSVRKISSFLFCN